MKILKRMFKRMNCNHVWAREKTHFEEMLRTRRTHKCKCMKCGLEKPAGLHLPPGPLTEEQVEEIIKRHYK